MGAEGGETIDLERVGSAGSAAIADIVFIHGLGGDAYKTWSGGQETADAFWPLWLAEAAPEFQVWTARYPAQLSNWFGPSFPLAQNATALLDRLTQRIGDRPIVFVCHSLGGLIAKQIVRTCFDTMARVDYRELANTSLALSFLERLIKERSWPV